MLRFTAYLTVIGGLIFITGTGVRAESPRPFVTASTSMIGCMIGLLAPELIEVQVLIPPAACPGTYDLRPSDAAKLAKSVLIIRHDYQSYLDRRFREQNRNIRLAILDTPGHLLVPRNFLSALGQLKEILSRQFPALGDSLEKNAAAAEKYVMAAGEAARLRFESAGMAQKTALCSDKQAGFALWAGVKSAGTFLNSPEELSALRMGQIIQIARDSKAQFIAGNLQSGGEKVALALAGQTGLPVCILSNFPGTNERNKDWAGLLADNTELLIRAASGGQP